MHPDTIYALAKELEQKTRTIAYTVTAMIQTSHYDKIIAVHSNDNYAVQLTPEAAATIRATYAAAATMLAVR